MLIKKILLIVMLMVMSAVSFAVRGDRSQESSDFYNLYSETYNAVESPDMHDKIGISKDEMKVVKDIINNGWYKIKLLEVDKLKEVFAIDKLMMDGPGNREAINKYFEKIEEISAQMTKVYEDTQKELKKHIDMDKMK